MKKFFVVLLLLLIFSLQIVIVACQSDGVQVSEATWEKEFKALKNITNYQFEFDGYFLSRTDDIICTWNRSEWSNSRNNIEYYFFAKENTYYYYSKDEVWYKVVASDEQVESLFNDDSEDVWTANYILETFSKYMVDKYDEYKFEKGNYYVKYYEEYGQYIDEYEVDVSFWKNKITTITCSINDKIYITINKIGNIKIDLPDCELHTHQIEYGGRVTPNNEHRLTCYCGFVGNIDSYEKHTFDDQGVCTKCGHKHIMEGYYADPNGHFAQCEDCGYYEGYIDELHIYGNPHTFENGYCTLCGFSENNTYSYFMSNNQQKWFVIIDIINGEILPDTIIIQAQIFDMDVVEVSIGASPFIAKMIVPETVEAIYDNMTSGSSDSFDIYYEGTSWDNHNEPIKLACNCKNIYCYSESVPQHSQEGVAGYWHWNDDHTEPIIWD